MGKHLKYFWRLITSIFVLPSILRRLDAYELCHNSHDTPDDDSRWAVAAEDAGICIEDYRTLMRAYDFTYNVQTGSLAGLVAGDHGYKEIPSFMRRDYTNALLQKAIGQITDGRPNEVRVVTGVRGREEYIITIQDNCG